VRKNGTGNAPDGQDPKTVELLAEGGKKGPQRTGGFEGGGGFRVTELQSMKKIRSVTTGSTPKNKIGKKNIWQGIKKNAPNRKKCRQAGEKRSE